MLEPAKDCTSAASRPAVAQPASSAVAAKASRRERDRVSLVPCWTFLIA
jgi:hypothetical protein